MLTGNGMISKKLYYYVVMIFFISFTVKAEIMDRKHIATIYLNKLVYDPFFETTVLKITPNSIIKYPDYPEWICSQEELKATYCLNNREEAEYEGHHDFFDLVPTTFLSGSSFFDPRKHDGSGYKIAICFTEGHCNLWNFDSSDSEDKEVMIFEDKLFQILAGKSEYEFKPILAK